MGSTCALIRSSAWQAARMAIRQAPAVRSNDTTTLISVIFFMVVLLFKPDHHHVGPESFQQRFDLQPGVVRCLINDAHSSAPILNQGSRLDVKV